MPLPQDRQRAVACSRTEPIPSSNPYNTRYHDYCQDAFSGRAPRGFMQRWSVRADTQSKWSSAARRPPDQFDQYLLASLRRFVATSLHQQSESRKACLRIYYVRAGTQTSHKPSCTIGSPARCRPAFTDCGQPEVTCENSSFPLAGHPGVGGGLHKAMTFSLLIESESLGQPITSAVSRPVMCSSRV